MPGGKEGGSLNQLLFVWIATQTDWLTVKVRPQTKDEDFGLQFKNKDLIMSGRMENIKIIASALLIIFQSQTKFYMKVYLSKGHNYVL